MVVLFTITSYVLAGTTNSSYTIVCPRNEGWGTDSAARQSKTTTSDGYSWLTSSTNGRRIKYLIVATNGNTGTQTGFIRPGNGVNLLRGAVQVGNTVDIKAAAYRIDAGVYQTTAKGSWRSN